MTQIGGAINDRCPTPDVAVGADDDGSLFSAACFVRSASQYHKQAQHIQLAARQLSRMLTLHKCKKLINQIHFQLQIEHEKCHSTYIEKR